MQPVVLLVDDEKSIRSALCRVFKKNKFHVIEAESGQAALEALEANVVDVVVSDQRMPFMSGTELLSKVKKEYPDVGRIMLSGQSDVDDLYDAINEASVSRFLSKPWDEEQLVGVVKEALPQALVDFSIKAARSNTSEMPLAGTARNNSVDSDSGNGTLARKNSAMASVIKEAILRHQES